MVEHRILNKKYVPYLVFALFIICPFLSLPAIFAEIYNGRKYPMIYLAIFMGLLSMFYFPFEDQYRYLMNLEYCKYLSFEEKFDFGSLMIVRELNLVYLVVFFAAKLNLTLEHVRFAFTLISCLLVFNIFLNVETTLYFQNKKQRLIAFLIILFSIPYFLICYGFRTGFGACLFTYAVYLIYIRNKLKQGIIFLLLATFTHFFFIIHLIICIIVYYTKYYISYKQTIVISVFFFLLSMSIFSTMYGNIPFLDELMDSYVYGEKYGYGLSYLLSTKILWFNGIIYTTFLFYVFIRLRHKGRFENLLYVLLIITIFSIPYSTLFQRIIRSQFIVIALYLLYHFNNRIVLKRIPIILIFAFIASTYHIFSFRSQYKIARIDKILYSPFPCLINNHYDLEFVQKHVYIDGEFDKK